MQSIWNVHGIKKVDAEDEFLSRHDFQTEIWKGNNSIQTVDGVMVLVLCSSSDDALYLYQATWK